MIHLCFITTFTPYEKKKNKGGKKMKKLSQFSKVHISEMREVMMLAGFSTAKIV